MTNCGPGVPDRVGLWLVMAWPRPQINGITECFALPSVAALRVHETIIATGVLHTSRASGKRRKRKKYSCLICERVLTGISDIVLPAGARQAYQLSDRALMIGLSKGSATSF